MAHDNKNDGHSGGESFWKSRAASILIVFLAIVGFLMTYEHRVHLFTGYGGLAGLLAICVVMVLFIILISHNADKQGS